MQSALYKQHSKNSPNVLYALYSSVTRLHFCYGKIKTIIATVSTSCSLPDTQLISHHQTPHMHISLVSQCMQYSFHWASCTWSQSQWCCSAVWKHRKGRSNGKKYLKDEHYDALIIVVAQNNIWLDQKHFGGETADLGLSHLALLCPSLPY